MRLVSMLLILVFGVRAQSISETESARAHRLLSSPQWIDKAWGVYFAGRLHAEEWRDPLVEALREATALRSAGYKTEEHGYLAALFDAAIDSGFKVPPEVLEPFEGTAWQADVIILLARASENEEALLRLREQPSMGDDQWIAVNNLLLERKSARFFAKTLSEVKISQTFTITDGERLYGTGIEAGGASCGDGLQTMPKGFPPVVLYEIVTDARAGDIFLADGPDRSYYRKVVIPTDKQVGTGTCGPWGDRERIRVGYLARQRHLSVRDAEALFHARTHVVFQDDAGLAHQIDQALSAQEAAIRAFAKGIPGVSGMGLRIEPQLEDQRKSGAPTPTLTAREFVLE
jgi:hypothetical protein